MLLPGRKTPVAILLGLLVLLLSMPAGAGHPGRGRGPGPTPGRDLRSDRGLVACWNHEAPHRRLVPNSAGGGLQGTNHGAAWLDGALEFDGSGDFVSIGPPLRKLTSLSTGTISVWFKADSERFGSCVQPILYIGDADGGYDNTSLIIELGHFWPDQKKTALFFTILTEPGLMPTFCFDTLFDLELNTWYHFVAVVGDDFNTAYLNGVELTGRNYNYGGPHDSVFLDDIPKVGTCLIGKGWFWLFTDPCFFDGRIGEVRIYNRPLDAREVRRLYEERRPDPGRRKASGSVDLLADASPDVAAPSALLQNQPNPFATLTRIPFVLPAAAPVRLEVLDVQGRLVRTLADETLGAGPHSREWDGRDARGEAVPNGLYFYRLVIEGKAQPVRKALLLR